MAETQNLDTVETFFGYPISTYSTAQAVEDGVLVPLDGFRGKNNAATWQVREELTGRIEGKAFDMIDLTRLGIVWDGLAAQEPDEDGWRVHELGGKTYWMIPNELGGHTLMFPEDIAVPPPDPPSPPAPTSDSSRLLQRFWRRARAFLTGR